jgi:hypothetical protein
MDHKFSESEFARLGLDTDAAGRRAHELEHAAGKRVFAHLRDAVRELVGELNELGHQLELDEEVVHDSSLPLGISFVDDREDDHGTVKRRLRIAFDLTVSVGYAHLSRPESNE